MLERACHELFKAADAPAQLRPPRKQLLCRRRFEFHFAGDELTLFLGTEHVDGRKLFVERRHEFHDPLEQ